MANRSPRRGIRMLVPRTYMETPSVKPPPRPRPGPVCGIDRDASQPYRSSSPRVGITRSGALPADLRRFLTKKKEKTRHA